jgi:hypothetical protein
MCGIPSVCFLLPGGTLSFVSFTVPATFFISYIWKYVETHDTI